jgi:HEPN domain-containing protein
MKRMTREWIRKAEDDFRTAELVAAGGEPLHDQICFHCQQSAEKYLKALLEELTLPIARIHDLEDLLEQLLPHYSSLARYRRGLRFLTGFAVDLRYPLLRTSARRMPRASRPVVAGTRLHLAPSSVSNVP